MSRARLRSKTGCLRCRQRKKKCDEIKPECDACRRCGFSCVWPPMENRSTVDNIVTVVRPHESLSGIGRPITGHGFPRFRDQAEFSLLRSFDSVNQALLSPIGDFKRLDMSRYVTIALDEAWCRASLNTFTAHILSANSTDHRSGRFASVSYNAAVSHVRDRLKSPHLLYGGRDLMSIMIAIILLIFTQSLGSDNSSPPMTHYNLVAENGQKYFFHVQVKTASPLLRLMMEIIVHHFACMAVFHPVPEVARDITEWMENSPLFVGHSSSGVPTANISSELPGTTEIFQPILAVTNYDRRRARDWNDVSRLDGVLSRLEFLEAQLEPSYKDGPKHVAQMYVSKYQIFAIAIRIFCLKAKQPNLKPRATEVVQLVGKAVQIFSSNTLQDNHNIGLTWPLSILLCACSDQLTFRFFSRQIDKIEYSCERGFFKDLKTARDMLSHSFGLEDEEGRDGREGQTSGLPRFADNLHLLICRDGILSTFQNSETFVSEPLRRVGAEPSRPLAIRDIVH